MTKFFNKCKKLYFWPFAQIFEKMFSQNMALSCTALYGFLAPCQNLEKTKDKILRKLLDRRKEGCIEAILQDHSGCHQRVQKNSKMFNERFNQVIVG